MVENTDKEGYLFALESLIEYLKTAPKGFILFWVVLIILLVYTVTKAWNHFKWLFGG